MINTVIASRSDFHQNYQNCQNDKYCDSITQQSSSNLMKTAITVFIVLTVLTVLIVLMKIAV